MGVFDQHRQSGIEAVLLEEIFRVMPLSGYIGGEMSWILEDNAVTNKIISRIAGDPYKTYRVYGKML